MDWNDFSSNILSALKRNYKSLNQPERRFDGNETRIILQNYFVEIGISEYCGCASLSIRVNEYYDDVKKDWQKAGLSRSGEICLKHSKKMSAVK